MHAAVCTVCFERKSEARFVRKATFCVGIFLGLFVREVYLLFEYLIGDTMLGLCFSGNWP